MPLYEYKCENCKHEFEYHAPIAHRELACTKPCPKCSYFDVYRIPGCAGFTVPEGGCGNAANGYSSTHGDAENFKARQEGKPEPYKK